MVDLWPDDIAQPGKLKAPVTILREQASLLGKKTQNLVEAEVKQRDTAPWVRVSPDDRGLKKFGDFAYDFHIVAPALGHYRYQLFTATHAIELYPVAITNIDGDIRAEISPGQRADPIAKSEDELLEILRKIFGAKKTRQVIDGLRAQISPEPEITL